MQSRAITAAPCNYCSPVQLTQSRAINADPCSAAPCNGAPCNRAPCNRAPCNGAPYYPFSRITAVLAGCIRSVLISKMLDSTKGRKIGHARPAVPPLLHHPHNHLQFQQRPASPRMTRSTSYSSTRTELVTSYQSWNAFWRNIT